MLHTPGIHSPYQCRVPCKQQYICTFSTLTDLLSNQSLGFWPRAGAVGRGLCLQAVPGELAGWASGRALAVCCPRMPPSLGASGIWHLPQGLMGPKPLEGLQTRSCHCRTPTPRAFPLGEQPLGLRGKGRTTRWPVGRDCLTGSQNQSLQPGRSPRTRSWPPR